MIEIVNKYNNYLESLPELINKTYYKAEYFLKSLGISQATYYRKLRENAFSPKEVTIITKLLFPKETYLEEIKADLLQSKEDISKGDVTGHKELQEQLRKEYT